MHDALPARAVEPDRPVGERHESLAAFALVARPDEDAGGTQLEAAEPAELDLERALGADELAGALVAPEQRHAPSIRLEM